MRTPALTLAAASLVVLALPAEAQWNVERRSGNAIAVATGIDGQIEVGVSCQGNNQVVVLTLPGATFRNGDVEVQWDNGSTEQYALQNQNNSAFPGSHERWVEWDALEAGKLYMIQTTVHAQASYRTQRLGVWRFPGGGMFKVYERLFHDGVLWYRAKWIKPETIGDRHDILGWTKAAGLRGHGAYELR